MNWTILRISQENFNKGLINEILKEDNKFYLCKINDKKYKIRKENYQKVEFSWLQNTNGKSPIANVRVDLTKYIIKIDNRVKGILECVK